MTATPQENMRVIVVAEEEIYNLLRDSGLGLDVQHRVESVGQMWDDLSSERLDQQSSAIFFSDTIYAGEGDLESALATMAPAAATFLITWNPSEVGNLVNRVRETASALGSDPNAPINVIDTSNKQTLLDTVRNVFATNGHNLYFPGYYNTDTTGPLVHVEQETAAWEPTPTPAMEQPAPQLATPPVPQPTYTPAPVPQPVAPVAPVPQQTYVQPPAYPQPTPAVGTYEKPSLPGQVTMAVTSSKGGSGKSTTAMMLAAQISQSSQKAFNAGLTDKPLKVVLVDMDTRDGQVASLIARYIPTALNIRVSPTWDEETILANLVHDPKLGIDALLAPVRPRTADDVGPDFYRQVIRTLKTTHDVVIMDTSVNYLDPLISTVCLPEATAILFVTTLATTSVQGMARALREITEPAEHGGMGIKRTKIGIVVNQSITEVGMDKDQVLQAALKVSIVGAIPLATKDVLTCTNYNRMHQLLKHPLLGPAYYKLAKTCLPNAKLLPVYEEKNSPPAAQTNTRPIQPTPSGTPTPVQQPQPQKSRLFNRRG